MCLSDEMVSRFYISVGSWLIGPIHEFDLNSSKRRPIIAPLVESFLLISNLIDTLHRLGWVPSEYPLLRRGFDSKEFFTPSTKKCTPMQIIGYESYLGNLSKGIIYNSNVNTSYNYWKIFKNFRPNAQRGFISIR